MTTKEFSKLSGLNRNKIYALIHSGAITAKKSSGGWDIDATNEWAKALGEVDRAVSSQELSDAFFKLIESANINQDLANNCNVCDNNELANTAETVEETTVETEQEPLEEIAEEAVTEEKVSEPVVEEPAVEEIVKEVAPVAEEPIAEEIKVEEPVETTEIEEEEPKKTSKIAAFFKKLFGKK